MKINSGIIIVILSLIVPAIVAVKSIQFDQNCGGYLKQAADANTVELATERLGIALKYIEDNGLTNGYTSVVYRTEDENVGYWYDNIKASYNELVAAKNGSALEKSNVLMKVRESLTDNGEGGETTLTVPDGISRYPNNAIYGVLRLLSFILLIFGCAVVFTTKN